MKRIIVSALLDDEQEMAHLDALALRLGVSRSEVVRALLREGLDRNPVDERELETVRRGGRPKNARPRVSVGKGGQLVAKLGVVMLVALTPASGLAGVGGERREGEYPPSDRLNRRKYLKAA